MAVPRNKYHINLKMTDLRKKLYEVIFKADTPAGKAFDVVLIICILASVGVVMLDSVDTISKQYHGLFYGLEWVFTVLFTIEYILRMVCVPSKRRYATSFFGVVDLLAVLPTYLGLFVRGVSYLKVIRILRVLRIFRVLKLGNHMRQADTLRQALYASRQKIIVFLCFVLTLVVIIGSLMYSIEGTQEETGFTSIPASVYWAIVTLTTVGYGDISPQTPVGQALAAIVMLLGYSIIAVPAGIVTAQIAQTPAKAKMIACVACGNINHDTDAAFCKKCGTQLNRQEAE
ncbi:MAG: ion transporter [Planctomycetes bacterium]|nr:ion transporter [Planctomycetota bacterium]